MNLNGKIERLEDRVRDEREERELIYRAMALFDEADRTHGRRSVELHEQALVLFQRVGLVAVDREIARVAAKARGDG